MLHYYPPHVSSFNMPIFRRKNCIHTASVIFALCKRLYSTQCTWHASFIPPPYTPTYPEPPTTWSWKSPLVRLVPVLNPDTGINFLAFPHTSQCPWTGGPPLNWLSLPKLPPPHSRISLITSITSPSKRMWSWPVGSSVHLLPPHRGSPPEGCLEDRHPLRGRIWQHALGGRYGVKPCASPAGMRKVCAAGSLNWSIFSASMVSISVS